MQMSTQFGFLLKLYTNIDHIICPEGQIEIRIFCTKYQSYSYDEVLQKNSFFFKSYFITTFCEDAKIWMLRYYETAILLE